MQNEKIHWRKTAKVCPQCNTLKSQKSFIHDFDACVSCSWEKVSQINYKQCGYCRNWKEASEIPTNQCKTCLKIVMEKHHQYKKFPKLKRNETYICIICNQKKSHLSFSRGSDINNLQCKLCVTKIKIENEGKFRCKGCESVFPKEQGHWNFKYCTRCYEKNKKWNKEKLQKLRDSDPKWQKYFKEYSKYYYWNVIHPIYKKVLNLQWQAGVAKKRRKYSRDKGFYMLNHSLFEDFRKRPGYWYQVCSDALQAIKKGEKFLYRGKLQENDVQDSFTKDPEYKKRMLTDDW